MRVCPTCYAQESDDASFCGLCGTRLFEVKSGETSLVGLTVADKYEIDRLIARGGMGEVYLGQHKKIGQQVAVKVLSRRLTSDATVVMRFFNEAKTYGKVRHPNAVNIHDFGQLDDGTLYMIMEYVDGETLTEHLKRFGPLPTKRVLQISIQLADVLFAAHTQDVVHRDLKPDNIMLIESSPGRFAVKVLDFGIAKVLGDKGISQLTETGMVFGTPEFMSPEQALGLDDVDYRADIYSFGMLLIYMLTGRLPFEGSNKMAILNRQVNEIPKRPSQLAPDGVEIHQDLEAVVLKCIRKNRDDRYADLEKVLADLELISAGQPPATAKRPREHKDTVPAIDAIDIADDNSPGATKTYSSADEPLVLLGDDEPTVAADPLERMFNSAPNSDVVTAVADAVPEEILHPHSAITRVAGAVDDGVDLDMDFDEASRVEPAVGIPDSSPGMEGPDTDAPTRKSIPNVDGGSSAESEPTRNARPGNSAPYQIGTSPPVKSADDGPIIVTPDRPPEPDPSELEPTGVRVAPSGEIGISGLGNTADEGFSLGGDDEGDGFSIGDSLSLGVNDLPSSSYSSNRGSGALVGAIVFVVLVLAGVGVWFFVLRDTGPEPAEAKSGAVANPETDPETDPDEDTPDEDEAVDATAPTEPPTAMSRAVRRDALSRLMATQAQKKLQTADLESMKKLLAHGRKHGGDMPEEYANRYTRLEADATTVEDALSEGKKAKRRLECDEIDDKIPLVENISPAAAKELGEMKQSCKYKLEAPPTRLE